ncbi:UNKNOWN [Stylonychia lemnae]|uniref:Uncharacterized protein n=1 Tax=Stylonychia lemnae TaxID=5949 RepID=A0A078B265_STYLE|nr:UNKNOWN [Stylonychia lemnae]|eukprot:CDW88630.1 UNKNOWN [Stylonychia lemnae]
MGCCDSKEVREIPKKRVSNNVIASLTKGQIDPAIQDLKSTPVKNDIAISGTGGIRESVQSSRDHMNEQQTPPFKKKNYKEDKIGLKNIDNLKDPLFTSVEDMDLMNRADELALNRMISLDTQLESSAQVLNLKFDQKNDAGKSAGKNKLQAKDLMEEIQEEEQPMLVRSLDKEQLQDDDKQVVEYDQDQEQQELQQTVEDKVTQNLIDEKVFVKYLKKGEIYDSSKIDPEVQQEIDKVINDYLEKDELERDQESDSKYLLPQTAFIKEEGKNLHEGQQLDVKLTFNTKTEKITGVIDLKGGAFVEGDFKSDSKYFMLKIKSSSANINQVEGQILKDDFSELDGIIYDFDQNMMLKQGKRIVIQQVKS